MSIPRLRYFVAIAQERSFVRAAARLHITQSALSQQLRRLEQEMGATLVTRTPRAVTLTDAGRALLAEARDIIYRYDHLPRVVRAAAREGSSAIRIGAVPSAIIGLIPALTVAFHDAAPGVDLVVEEVGTPEQLERLRSGSLDVGIFRSLHAPAELSTVRLPADDYFVCLPEKHPLASRATVRWSELESLKIVLARREIGRAMFDAVIAACHSFGFSPDVMPVRVQGFHLTSWVAAGSGVTVIPGFATPQRHAATVVRPLEPRVSVVPLHVGATAGTLTGEVRTLLDLARSIEPPGFGQGSTATDAD